MLAIKRPTHPHSSKEQAVSFEECGWVFFSRACVRGVSALALGELMNYG